MSEPKAKPSFAARMGRPLLAAAAATVSMAAPSAVLADIFLNLDGIKGESQDEKFKDQIDLLSYTQSFRNNGSVTGGGGGAGRVTCGAVTVLKNIDRASPHLIEFVATGKHIPTGVLSFRSASGKDTNAPYYKVTLTDILVSGIDQTDNPDPGKIVEKVTLSATKFKFEYRPQNADGSLGAAVDFGFDCRTNTKF